MGKAASGQLRSGVTVSADREGDPAHLFANPCYGLTAVSEITTADRYRGVREGLIGLSHACQEWFVMTEAPRPRRTRSADRSPEVVARLQRSRQRSLQRRTDAAVREKAITRAVGDYLAAWSAITSVEQRRDSDVAALRAQIDSVITGAAAEITTHEDAQAAAAAAVRAHVQTDEELADLLEITVKRARQLLAGSRATNPEQSRRKTSSKKPDPTSLPTRIDPGSRNLLADKASTTSADGMPSHVTE
ncbi:hypothetical protein ACQP1O_17770 [Nocardia sp. CA-151230]|uniref:hypothetical protein n=1 Tax=Nocardia sp. CA-151230 TaxID=3239982 RepID=UPI003D925EAC